MYIFNAVSVFDLLVQLSKELGSDTLRGCLTATCKAFSLANAKRKGVNELVIRSLDDWD